MCNVHLNHCCACIIIHQSSLCVLVGFFCFSFSFSLFFPPLRLCFSSHLCACVLFSRFFSSATKHFFLFDLWPFMEKDREQLVMRMLFTVRLITLISRNVTLHAWNTQLHTERRARYPLLHVNSYFLSSKYFSIVACSSPLASFYFHHDSARLLASSRPTYSR